MIWWWRRRQARLYARRRLRLWVHDVERASRRWEKAETELTPEQYAAYVRAKVGFRRGSWQ